MTDQQATPSRQPPSEDNVAPYDAALLDSVDTGDVVLFSRSCSAMGSPLGIGICKFAKWTSLYDHVGVVVRPQDAKNGEPMVLEAGFRGVTLKPLAERLARPHHERVAVRRLLLDPSLVSTNDEGRIRQRIERFARESEGAPYKRRLTDLTANFTQPPEKREAWDIAAAVNATLRQDAALRKDLNPAEPVSQRQRQPEGGHVAEVGRRRLETLRRESDMLQASKLDHIHRTERDLPTVVMGRSVERSAGYVCTELIAAALQQGEVLDDFPSAHNYGTHDFTSLAAATTADEVRRRQPPNLVPGAALGPERLLKAEDGVLSNSASAVPAPSSLFGALEGLGWSFDVATQVAESFQLRHVQRGEQIELGDAGNPSVAVVPSSTRLLLASNPAAPTPATPKDGLCEMLLPTLTPFGIAPRQQTGASSQPLKKLIAIAESDGYVWTASAADVRATHTAACKATDQSDLSRVQLRRREAAPWVARASSNAERPLALYVVESGAVYDESVDRVYREGEVVGLDAFLAHTPCSSLHGGWDGAILSARAVPRANPMAVRKGTTVRLVSADEVLSSGLVPLAEPSAARVNVRKKGMPPNHTPLAVLQRRYRLFCAHADGRLQTHQKNPTLVAHMDVVHRHHYFAMAGLPQMAHRLLDTCLFQGRQDDRLLFSDVLRIERGSNASTALLTGKHSKAQAMAAAHFIGTQASRDGVTVSVTQINDVLNSLYRGRADAPYLTLSQTERQKSRTGDEVLDHFNSDGNRMNRPVLIPELVKLVQEGLVIVPVAVATDTAVLLRHLHAVYHGTTSDGKLAGAAEEEDEEEPTPEQYLAEDLSKLVRGEAWDMSSATDAFAMVKRFWGIVAASVAAAAVVFPLQFVSSHRQLFGHGSTRTVRGVLRSTVSWSECFFHSLHGLAIRRAALGSAVFGVGALLARPSPPVYDSNLDDLPRHPRWESAQFGAAVCAGATLATYPLDVAFWMGMHRSVTRVNVEDSAMVNFHTSQAVPRTLLGQAWQAHGVRGLFRGAHLAWVSMTPFFGAHWLWYHEFLAPLFIAPEYAPSALFGTPPDPESFYASSSLAAMGWKTGIIGAAYVMHALCAYPVETIRVVSMAEQKRASHVARSILTNSGGARQVVQRLYCGFGAHLARTVPFMLGSFGLSGLAATSYTVGPPTIVSEAASELNNRSLHPFYNFRRLT